MKTVQRFISTILICAAIALFFAVGLNDVQAQSNISPMDKWSWGENTGWTNWYDDGVASGAEIEPSAQVLSRFIWNENYGWLYLGDGSPDFGPTYGNTTAADTGVNIALTPLANLTGYAWGEHIGWVNFGPLPGVPIGSRARVLRGCPAWTFGGFAWGENVGWINLNTTAFSSLTTDPADPMIRADLDFNGLRNGLDVQDFTRVLMTGPANINELVAADMNFNGTAEVGDIPGFVDCLLNGNCLCP